MPDPVVPVPVVAPAPVVAVPPSAPVVEAPPAAPTPPAAEPVAAPIVSQETKPAEPAKVEPAKVEPEKPADRPASLLAPKEEPKAEAKTEPTPEPTVPEPVKYADFTLPEGVSLKNEEVGKYTEILGQHKVPQEAAQQLVDLYVSERQREAELQRTNWNRMMEGWVEAFHKDPQMGGSKSEATLTRVKATLDQYATDVGPQQRTALISALDMGGLDRHPEVVRFINWAAGKKVESTRIVAAASAKPPKPTRAQARYATSLPLPNGAG